MKKHTILSCFVTVGFLVSACGGQLGSSSSDQQPAPAVTTVIVQAPASEPTQAAGQSSESNSSVSATTSATQASVSSNTTAAQKDEQCGTKTSHEAVEENILDVYGTALMPADYQDTLGLIKNTYWIYAGDNYDPCADLSWVVLAVPASTSSPRQIMLFHKGEYIGNPAKVTFGFQPEVTRLADNKIQVSYRWNEGSEPTAGAKVRAISTFTYNPSTGGVTHEGDFPSGGNIDSQGNLPVDKAVPYGASVRAGGSLTGHAIEMKKFASPTRNIFCDLEKDTCYIKNPEQTIKLGDYKEVAHIQDTIPSYAESSAENAAIANYGTTVYSGGNACDIEETGVTCWKTFDGHGAFISRDHTMTF